jgi:AbrB family looped-hinge helix DNA binding protein
MAMARVTAKGQVTIPVEVRKSLDIKEGDDLLFEVAAEGEARIRIIKRRSLMDLYGALPATRAYPGKEAVRAAVGRSLGKRHAGRKP